MKNKVIDFTYANKEQKNFLEHLESSKGIKHPSETLNVPMWLILALHSELSEVLNASKLHKFWDKSEVNREHLIEELGDFLSHMANLANFLEVDLITIYEIKWNKSRNDFNVIERDLVTNEFKKLYGKRIDKLMGEK
mgnify:CR=1 FL=1